MINLKKTNENSEVQYFTFKPVEIKKRVRIAMLVCTLEDFTDKEYQKSIHWWLKDMTNNSLGYDDLLDSNINNSKRGYCCHYAISHQTVSIYIDKQEIEKRKEIKAISTEEMKIVYKELTENGKYPY